nr:hypothetical protein [Phyllobacterium sophorae]
MSLPAGYRTDGAVVAPAPLLDRESQRQQKAVGSPIGNAFTHFLIGSIPQGSAGVAQGGELDIREIGLLEVGRRAGPSVRAKRFASASSACKEGASISRRKQ